MTTAPLRDGWRERPSPERLSPAHPRFARVLAAHAAALAAGDPTYVDPLSGYLVMTADTLLARGECCATGCRHCPWADADGPARGDPDVHPTG